MSELARLPDDWNALVGDQIALPYFATLRRFVAEQRRSNIVYPPADQVFRAFELTPVERLRVVLLGQDPYHGEGQACGLSFSVSGEQRLPPSLLNMFKELESDLGYARPRHGDLSVWATAGVLLLNTVLTVRAGAAHSHRGQGWERFTDTVIARLSSHASPKVFLLWGGAAKKKSKLIDECRHRILTSAHPSPLSAHRGFMGSRPYSLVNDALRSLGREPVDWRLPDGPHA